MFISKGLKALGTALVSILIFGQTAMATPATIFYKATSGVAAGQVVQADYSNALSNAPMKSALISALSSVELANGPLFVTDTNGSVIDYEQAISKAEGYVAALSDTVINHATAPTATYKLNADGTVSPITALTVKMVSAVTATTVVGTQPTLPAQVSATMSDNSTQQVAVTWGTVDVSKAGTVTVTGTIAGTAVTATATVTVTATIASVSAVNSTIVVGGTTRFTFTNSDGNTVATPTGVTYSVIGSNASDASITNGVFTTTIDGTYTIQATIGSVTLTTGVTVTAANVSS
ncbi:exported hypothetical protein [Candidatus Desulfosporosinus infrequens]|uniref:Bacterial Ig-like domain-containing protein n=1 Tax=Candidatus Desulfosporosinus infrequens TaxID=2043169 RepID=A0A2U3K4B9_9FIRM|nr:exported hypothetical protein [Candidatus Desulfosporosinus infrequens]